MFAGLVEELGHIVDIADAGPGKRLRVAGPLVSTDAAIGDSIAINGCCLTVVAIDQVTLDFDAGPETLRRTNLGQLAAQSSVNLERSLKIGDRLGGHFVTGHIDVVGQLLERQDDQDWSTFWFAIPETFSRQMASKGSVAVDGVSLTVVDALPDRFSVALIPHTLSVTTLGQLSVGDPVNLESDLLAKYVQRQIPGPEPTA